MGHHRDRNSGVGKWKSPLTPCSGGVLTAVEIQCPPILRMGGPWDQRVPAGKRNRPRDDQSGQPWDETKLKALYFRREAKRKGETRTVEGRKGHKRNFLYLTKDAKDVKKVRGKE